MARKSKYEKLYIYQLPDEEIKQFIVQDVLRQYPDATFVPNAFDALRKHGTKKPCAFFEVQEIERKKETAKATVQFTIQELGENGFGKPEMKFRLVNIFYEMNDFDCQNSHEPNRKTMNRPWVEMIYNKFNDIDYAKNAIKYEKEVLNRAERSSATIAPSSAN